MKKKVNLKGRDVEYTLKSSRRARRMRLAIYRGGGFVVTIPRGLKDSITESFLQKKSAWILNTIETFARLPRLVFRRGYIREYNQQKADALAFVQGRIDFLNKFYGFKIGKIVIRNQKTRWGSCSRGGNLNFNYRILHLPKELADYIIAHEICHKDEFNHSRNFWNLVARALPQYAELRARLRQYDLGLS